MTFIVDLIEYVEPIAPSTRCGTMRDYFADHPGCDLLVVADAGQVVGVVCRSMLRDHDADLTADILMVAPLAIDFDATIEAACDLLLADGEPQPGLVVLRDGFYAGHLTTRALLRNRRQKPAAEDDNQRFAQMVSHAVRAPLNGVLAVAELLQRQPLSVDSQAYVRTILESGQATLRALNDALELARAEAGNLAFEPQPVQLRGFMDEMAAAWEPRAAQDGVSLMVAYDGDPELSAQTDPARLRQVFDKLIQTALRINRRGVVEASLQAVRTPDGLRLIGRVRDTGGGLSAVKLDSPAQGSGLALCKRIVERLGGALRIDSNTGAGSTICFEYPAGVAEQQAEAPIDGGETLTRSAHVLVVDDNATNRMVAEALCEMFDCTSECVEDGLQAVEAAKTGRFDVILMDIRMPHMDGVEATRAIRALSGPAGTVPIIALTANADPDDAQIYAEAGMQGVVEKPLKPERLLQAMNAVLTAAAEGHAAAA
jgi:CheY-like chemotaxis protein/signal transduction histidine kinase